ncbi:MAG: class I SAM-dependent DNA methyltransferase, partial [Deltaproteobacteria bacterium]|nr:class I SAM-dependent DNA methyltransferase [Deltaproteobacteria bacterium]
MATPDPHTRAHFEWLGFIQPNGLVVSAPALVKAGAILNRHDVEGQELLDTWLNQRDGSPARTREHNLQDFLSFAKTVLGWGFSPKGYAGTEETPIPAELEVPLPDYGETLRPDFAVRERDPQAGELPWQLLVQVLDEGKDLVKSSTGAGGLETSPQGRMERLLRATGVPAGVLFNGVALRLVSAPRGESSGWMDFRVADMAQTAGRPLCAALRLLLCEQRLLTGPKEHRLAALLADSRRYQNEVSERLSEQVMHALYDLLRGFQAAHDESRGELLREPLFAEGDPNDIYRGLLAVILRLVFLLYAEERGMLPGGETFIQHYSVGGLYQRLREEAALHPDTMDQRYGAWAQLLVLFRLIHDGAGGHKTGGIVSLPERRGALFNPDRYPFLEGRHSGGGRQITERVQPPRVSDGAVYRVLEKLVVLDGERISYRTLDVEQIGSVYEVIMGFRLETATGRSVAVKSG